VPVRVTGVGFFDFPHNQSGHAPNFIELHPALDILFNPGSGPPPSSTPTPQPSPTLTPQPSPTSGQDVIVDGGFESATEWGNEAPGWRAASNSNQEVIIAGGSFPHAGGNYAFMGKANNVSATLQQTVAMPSNAGHLVLKFALNVVTAEPSTATSKDRLRVEVRDGSGNVLATVATFSNRDASRSSNKNGQYFAVDPIDLSQFKGQSVVIVFHATTNASRPTTFRIDDVTIASGP
jgi:hypothetical protein